MVYLGIPVYNHFDRSIVALLLMIWKRMYKAHTQAELANNYWMQFCSWTWTWRVPQKAGTFCGKVCVGNWKLLMMIWEMFQRISNLVETMKMELKNLFSTPRNTTFSAFLLFSLNISDYNIQMISVTIFPFPFT